MQLINKIKAVNRVYRELDSHITRFRKQSGLSCVANCGLCCTKPEIDATVLECLPAAFELYRKGMSDITYERLENKADNRCVFFSPFAGKGYCSNYTSRPLICRLFGYSTRQDKTGQLALVSCKPIKEQAPVSKLVKCLPKAPGMNAYYMKLYGIDPKLSLPFYPINEAMMKALEIVIMYHQFRNKRA